MAITTKAPAWWPECQVVARFRLCLGTLASATRLLPAEEDNGLPRPSAVWLAAESLDRVPAKRPHPARGDEGWEQHIH